MVRPDPRPDGGGDDIVADSHRRGVAAVAEPSPWSDGGETEPAARPVPGQCHNVSAADSDTIKFDDTAPTISW